jgi:hypothetical protein
MSEQQQLFHVLLSEYPNSKVILLLEFFDWLKNSGAIGCSCQGKETSPITFKQYFTN